MSLILSLTGGEVAEKEAWANTESGKYLWWDISVIAKNGWSTDYTQEWRGRGSQKPEALGVTIESQQLWHYSEDESTKFRKR